MNPELAAPLDESELDELLALATEVARGAGEVLVAQFGGATEREVLRSSASSKTSPTDLVSEADRASERFIALALESARPADGILGEEGATRPSTSGVTWVVDPLDGTINYLYGIPAFAVSIAATLGGRAVAGVVHNPALGETFAAGLGLGATLNDARLRLGSTEPERGLSESLVGTGFGYQATRRDDQGRVLSGVLRNVRDIRRFGAAALDLCSVACGRLDAYFEAGLAPWDLAAGELIASEAGASVVGLEGIVDGATTVVAAPERLLTPLVELLRRAARDATIPGGARSG